MESKVLKPFEILEASIDLAETKTKGGFVRYAVLGLLAGVFIAFGAQASNMAAFNLLASTDTYGLGRILSGVIFAAGLMMVVISGCELFTGNLLMVSGVIRKRVRLRSMLLNWGVVYVFNFIGAIFIAWMINRSGLLHNGADLLGGVTVKIAAGKTGLDFFSAFILGVMCNWLVCMAIWLSLAADTMAGKLLGIFFPIWLFVTSGFEHSIANMYFIPSGIMAKANQAFIDAAISAGSSPDAIGELTWKNLFVANLVPVTLGNIIGGGVFVSMAFLLAFRKPKTEGDGHGIREKHTTS